MKRADINIEYHTNQEKIFLESNARYKVIAKGRRFGLTRGFANYVIDNMLDGVGPILWVDTIYGNIERYFERYFLPVLKTLPKNTWKYRGNRNDLKVLQSVCDFRSADRPENIEGFGYALIIINEAGIVLKNRSLWNESIRPMIMDYKAKVLIGGTPKGKIVRRTNEKHLFYELYQRGLEQSAGNPPSLLCNDTPFTKGGLNGQRVYPASLETSPGQGTASLETSPGQGWESFNFSSYDNPLIDKAEIDELVSEISPALRDQEVFGLFVDKESNGIIKREWWRYYNKYELLTKRVYSKIQSWDTAFKDKEGNDFSVCTTWVIAHDGYYLIDVWKGRVEFPELKRKAIELNEQHNPNEILVEDKASGQSLIQELQRETRLPIKAITTDKDKVARVHSVTPLIEAGKVFLPNEAPWLNEFIEECEDFPDGEFDDTVDSVSQFLNYAKGRSSIILLTKEPIIHVARREMGSKYAGYRR